jgi:hypothetical protein
MHVPKRAKMPRLRPFSLKLRLEYIEWLTVTQPSGSPLIDMKTFWKDLLERADLLEKAQADILGEKR